MQQKPQDTQPTEEIFMRVMAHREGITLLIEGTVKTEITMPPSGAVSVYLGLQTILSDVADHYNLTLDEFIDSYSDKVRIDTHEKPGR